jgi:hypothetical protein
MTPETADKLYMTYLELSDLDFGEPVYMSDGIFILPDGSTYDEEEIKND